jgi:thioesterase domain-containing protein
VHLNTLRLHDFEGQVDYLWRRTRKRIGIILADLTGRILTALRMPLPHLVRYNYIARMIDQASAHYYTGQTYPGDVILFRASIQPEEIEPDPYLGWGEMVKGTLKIVDITGTHNSIMKEPHLFDLVHALETHLDGKPQT